MRTVLQDVRFGLRTLIKRPAFTAVVVLTLALGIGANTGIYSVVHGVLLRPLPYADPDRLVHISWHFGGTAMGQAVSADKFLFWQKHSRAFEETAVHDLGNSGFNLLAGNEPERVTGMRVSESIFRTIGVQPALGRGFTRDEDTPGGPRAAVLNDHLWKRRFASDRNIIGRAIQIDGQAHTVVGVMPAGFQFTPAADLWTPLRAASGARQLGNSYTMIARLVPGLSLEAAQKNMAAVLDRFREKYPNAVGENERGIVLGGYRDWIVGDTGASLLILFGAVGLVLLIACANVANLVLARGTARAGELAVRAALGATRGRLIRQLLTENVMLALLGGAVGLLVAHWSVPMLLALSPGNLPRLDEIRVDRQAALFALAAALATGLLSGLLPALRATRRDILDSLRNAATRMGTTRGRARSRGALVVGEVALSLVLLIGAGLLIGSFARLQAVDPGFSPKHVQTLQMSLTSDRYQTASQTWGFAREVVRRAAALPGVTAVAAASSLPTEPGLNVPLQVVGRTDENGSGVVEARLISPDYFQAMRIPMLRGRSFAETDEKGSTPVMIVNQTAARRFFQQSDPVGERMLVAAGAFGERERQVVGVVGDVREFGLQTAAPPVVYLPYPQISDDLTVLMNRAFPASWVMRSEGPIELRPALRDVVRKIDPQQPLSNVRPMTEVLGASFARHRFDMLLMGVFAGVALLLTAIGLYGVLSFQVSQRTGEIGLRMALGTRQYHIYKNVLGRGLALTLVGVALGLGAALTLTRMLSGMLFGISATDPLTFAGVSVLLTGVAALACYFPARRAARVDPMVALRYQ